MQQRPSVAGMEMKMSIKSVMQVLQAIRDLPIPGVTLSTMGGEACVAIDYAEAGVNDPADLEPIYKAH